MKNEKESEVNAAANEPTSQNVPKRELSQPKELSKLESPPLKTNMSQLTMEIPKEVSPVASAAPTEQNKSSPVSETIIYYLQIIFYPHLYRFNSFSFYLQ